MGPPHPPVSPPNAPLSSVGDLISGCLPGEGKRAPVNSLHAQTRTSRWSSPPHLHPLLPSLVTPPHCAAPSPSPTVGLTYRRLQGIEKNRQPGTSSGWNSRSRPPSYRRPDCGPSVRGVKTGGAGGALYAVSRSRSVDFRPRSRPLPPLLPPPRRVIPGHSERRRSPLHPDWRLELSPSPPRCGPSASGIRRGGG